MTGIRVFDGDLIRATLFNPKAERLFVSFRQRLGQPGEFNQSREVRNFTRQGYAHLHLQTRWNDWYINDETAALETTLTRLVQSRVEIVAMGFSMGGYAALRFAACLRLQQAILISPQYSIAPEHVPFDHRFRDSATGFDPELGDLYSRATSLRGVILADPFRPLDIINANLICSAFPRISIARVAGGGHPASQVLRQGGKFGQLQQLSKNPDFARHDILALHRKSRSLSAAYWRNLAVMAQKQGREGLAAIALEREQALLQNSE